MNTPWGSGEDSLGHAARLNTPWGSGEDDAGDTAWPNTPPGSREDNKGDAACVNTSGASVCHCGLVLDSVTLAVVFGDKQ